MLLLNYWFRYSRILILLINNRSGKLFFNFLLEDNEFKLNGLVVIVRSWNLLLTPISPSRGLRQSSLLLMLTILRIDGSSYDVEVTPNVATCIFFVKDVRQLLLRFSVLCLLHVLDCYLLRGYYSDVFFVA